MQKFIFGLGATLIGMLILFPLIILGTVLNGWVLTILWGWFMVPIFNLPALTLVPAMGVALVIGYLTKNVGVKADENAAAAMIVYPFITLLIGYVIQLFM